MWGGFVNMEWVLKIRTPSLTWFFKIFPFFVSSLFHCSLIALGYWFTQSLFYRDLGILIFLTTLLNYLIKAIFKIPRTRVPSLVKVSNPLGFPSGDIQVVLMVWGLLALRFQQPWFWCLASIVVACVGFSRLYLGVHTFLDIIGGSAIGFGSLLLYRWYVQTENYQKVCVENPSLFLSVMIIVVALYTIYFWDDISSLWISAMGLLIGTGISMVLTAQKTIPLVENLRGSYQNTTLAYGGFLLIFSGLEKGFRDNSPFMMLVRNGMISFSIFYLIPWVFHCFILCNK